MRSCARWAVTTLMVGAVAVVVAACNGQAEEDRAIGEPVASSQAPTTAPSPGGQPSWFFSQSAPRGAFPPPSSEGTGSLILEDAGALTVAITERPARAVTHRTTADFVAGWDQEFGVAPPNAVVAVLGAAGRQHEAEVGLLDPSFAPRTARLSYRVRILDGSLPPEFTDASLMIDDAGLDVQLNIVNQSEQTDDLTWVLYRVNQAFPGGPTVAWQLIENLGAGDNEPIEVGMRYAVSATDSMGNSSPQLVASSGQQYTVTAGSAGDVLTPSASGRPGQIAVVNGLPEAAMTATLFDEGRSVAVVMNVAPAQTAVFQVDPTIWIAAVPTGQVRAGQILDPATVSGATRFDLSGMASTDVVITGDGTQFFLRNTVMS